MRKLINIAELLIFIQTTTVKLKPGRAPFQNWMKSPN